MMSEHEQRGGYKHVYVEDERDGVRFTMRFSNHYGFWHCYAVQYHDVPHWQDVPSWIRESIQKRAALLEVRLMRTHPVEG